jgi:hypothetical protein
MPVKKLVLLLLPMWPGFSIFDPDIFKNKLLTMPIPNTPTNGDMPTINELTSSNEYYQQKANEARDIIGNLQGWADMPTSEITFTIKGRPLVSFTFEASESGLLSTVFTALLVHYQRRAVETANILDGLQDVVTYAGGGD